MTFSVRSEVHLSGSKSSKRKATAGQQSQGSRKPAITILDEVSSDPPPPFGLLFAYFMRSGGSLQGGAIQNSIAKVVRHWEEQNRNLSLMLASEGASSLPVNDAIRSQWFSPARAEGSARTANTEYQ